MNDWGEGGHALCTVLEDRHPFFDWPLSSYDVGISFYRGVSPEIRPYMRHLLSVDRKVVCLPYRRGNVVFSFIHSP